MKSLLLFFLIAALPLAPRPAGAAPDGTAPASALKEADAIDFDADPAKVEQTLQAAAQARPGDPAAVGGYARFLARLDRSEEAILLLRRLDAGQGVSIGLLWAEALWLRGETDEARQRLAAVPADPLAPWAAAQELLIKIEFFESRMAPCEAACRALLGRDPLSRTGRLYLARCLTRTGRFPEARLMLDAAAVAAPGDPEVLEAQAALLEAQGREGDAAKLLSPLAGRIEATPPRTVDGWVAAAAGLRRLGQLRAASQCIGRAARFAPADPFLQLERIRIFRAAWSLDEAGGRCAALLKRYPNSALALAEQAETVWRLKLNPQLTANYCERALQIYPTLLAARCRLAVFHLVASQWDKAAALLAKNREFNPSDPETARLGRALETLKSGDPDWAATAAAPAGALDLPFALRMGELALARADNHAAQTWYECAIKADPASGPAKKGAGVAAFRLGQYDRASRLLEEAFASERYDIEIKNLLDYLDAQGRSRLGGTPDLAIGAAPGNEALALYVEAAAARDLAAETARYSLQSTPTLRVQLCDRNDDLIVISQGIIPSCCCGRSDLGREGTIRYDQSIFLWTPQAAGGLNETYRLDEALYRSVAHVVVHEALGGRGPLWLREGLAGFDTMAHSPEWSPVALDTLIADLRLGLQLPLGELEGMLTGEENPFCRLYATLVIQEWSAPARREQLDALLERMRRGEPWQTAAEGAFGRPLAELDAQVRAAILRRYAALRPDPGVGPSLDSVMTAAPFSDEAKIDQARMYFLRKRLADARHALDPLLAGSAPPTAAVLLAGRIAWADGDSSAACALLERGLKLEERRQEKAACSLDYETLGLARLKLGRRGPAAEAFREAIRLDPLDSRKLGAYDELLKLLGGATPRPDEYYRVLEQRLPARRGDAEARLELARWHEAQGRPEQALAACLSVAGIRPEWIENRRLLGSLALRLKRYPEAYLSYRIIHQADPDEAEPLEKLIQCATQLGKTREADEYRAALKKIRDDIP